MKRNARERQRIQGMNEYLERLRDRLPAEWKTKKMSKLEILQKSSVYIRHLRRFLTVTESFDKDDKSSGDIILAFSQSGSKFQIPTNRWANNRTLYQNWIDKNTISNNNKPTETTGKCKIAIAGASETFYECSNVSSNVEVRSNCGRPLSRELLETPKSDKMGVLNSGTEFPTTSGTDDFKSFI